MTKKKRTTIKTMKKNKNDCNNKTMAHIPSNTSQADANNITSGDNLVNEDNVYTKGFVFSEDKTFDGDNIAAENIIAAKNNIISENNIIAKDNITAKDNIYAEINIAAKDNIADDNIVAEDNVVSEDNVFAEDYIVAEDNEITEDLDDDLDFMSTDQDISDQENYKVSLAQEKTLEFIVNVADNGIRIDKYLALVQSDISRSFIQKLIESEKITVDDKTTKVNYKVKAGNKVMIYIPAPIEAAIEPEDIPIDIIYEDKDIIIINKQKGLVVHPAAGHASGTLVNALLYHCKAELSGINGVMRPGIVHRIDRDTTGVLVACKNDKAHQFIADQLKVHSITRRYQAIVYNTFRTDSGRVEAPIGRDPKDRKKMAINYKNGKHAVTNYKLIENLNTQHSYIECSLETGRTHQIRVHMASIHHPLVGDIVYGPSKDPFHLEGQALHAGVLGFIHPTSREYVEFRAPLPEYFTNLLERLRYKR